MASSCSTTPAGGSSDIVYSAVTLHDVDECIQIEVEAAWDTCDRNAHLCAEAREERYQEHVKWAFAQNSRKRMLENIGDWYTIKAVQDGRIVGFLDASEITWVQVALVTHPSENPFASGELPRESLQKPIHELGVEDADEIDIWMTDRVLEDDYAQAVHALRDIKKSSTPYYNIAQLAVAPDRQGQGIAKGLINHLRQKANREGASMLALCRLEQSTTTQRGHGKKY
ncbi:hypothetical protein UCREL1_7295 [Eutypa lata UCREL1]|uniref:N-acetyltransferase domain-containing protein n=1 Tax=Eutypa lata (strain UCR-EL1) TaxID=1287681 RepID=M7SNG5_EUTLA|nr:hypothetical protein UCREL1_7295 [Eutypa lata UCREL1]